MPNQDEESDPLLDSAKESDDTVHLNEEELEKILRVRCRYWQKKLRLQDWNVEVTLKRHYEMAHPDCVGCTQIFDEEKDAKIELLSPLDIAGVAGSFINHEELNYDITLVHELLHLHFSPFVEDDTTPKGVAQEQAINAISKALVKAYLKDKDTEQPKHTPKHGHGHYL